MCCFFNRICCCRQRPIDPMPPTPIPPVPTLPIVNVGARFNLLAPTDVASGSIIPITNTVFNNALGFISNNSGTINLAGEGLYLINFAVSATNATATDSAITANLNINGAADSSAAASGVVAGGDSITLSNSTLVFVPQSSTTTVSLSATSDQTLALLPNVVITKLS